MINIESVSYKYKNGKRNILNDINLEVNDGEIIAIVGENGSGKSTLGKIISGILKIKNGKITIDGIDIGDKKNFQEIQGKVGIVFQNPDNQIIFSNIYDELSFSLKGLQKDEIEKRIDESLELVGMLDFKDQDLYTLSLGQKQRIMIAEVLAKRPKYIIFDEPTTMIDSQGKEKVYEIIGDLKKQGYTIICITNLADEILIADRTLILNDGKIACEIKKEDLIKKSHLLKEYNINEPVLLKVINKLEEAGIKIELGEISIENLVKALKENMKNE